MTISKDVGMEHGPRNNQRKIYLDSNKYIYKYQLKFLRNIIKNEKYFSSSDLREMMDKFIIYNFISEIQEVYNDAASLVWFEEQDSVAYQFPHEGRVVSSLSGIGYSIPEDEWE